MSLQALLDLRTTFTDYRTVIAAYRGAVRLLRPHTLERDTRQRHEALIAENDAIRLAPRTEHDRIAHTLRTEIEGPRRLAVAAARYRAHSIRQYVAEAHEAIARARRDVSLSFPGALNGVDANGMIMLGLLRVQMLPLLSTMSASGLLQTYEQAMQRADARAMVEAEIIEELARLRGARLASSDDERPAAKALRDYVEGIEELRLPPNLPDFDALLVDVDRLDSRADLLSVLPTADAAAVTVYTELQPTLIEAGTADDADDQREILAEMQGR